MNNKQRAPEKAAEVAQWHPLYAQFCRTDIEACQIPQVCVAPSVARRGTNATDAVAWRSGPPSASSQVRAYYARKQAQGQ
jgi:hypothetical protein